MKTEFAECCFPMVCLPVGSDTDCKLMEDWAVTVGPFALALVPAGTTTDGASIPRALWWICGTPLESPRVYAALFHDWLYGGGIPSCTRAEADECYYLLLRHFGISWLKAKTEYYVLRAFGWSHWLSNFFHCF